MHDLTITEGFPDNSSSYDLVVLWSYKKLIPHLENKENIIVFHSSDLPKGKGWAPIYYSIVNNEIYYTISGFRPNNEVDSGNILVKARFKMKVQYCAEDLRLWDHEICLMLINGLLERSNDGKKLTGIIQEGVSTFYPKRKPSDSEISLSSSLSDVWLQVRASEVSHPSYFTYEGQKYIVKIKPEIKPSFPDDLLIEFYC